MKDKILNYRVETVHKELLIGICFFIFGLIVSFAKVAGIFSPFCISFSMALPKKRAIFSFLGAIVGNFIFLSFNSLVYIFALLIGLVLKSIFDFKTNFANSVSSMVAFLFPQMFSIVFTPVGLETTILMYTEIVLCGCITFIFSNSLNFKKSLLISTDIVNSLAGFFIVGIALMLSFCNLEFFGFNFGRFFALLAIIISFLLAGASGGSIVGIISIMGLTLFTKSFTNFGLTVAVAGFLAGVFKIIGKHFQMIIFSGMYLFGCIFLGGFTFVNLLEVVFAIAISYIVPIHMFKEIFEKSDGKDLQNIVTLNEEISLKLQFTASALIDLQNRIERCAKQMDTIMFKDISYIYDNASDEVCRSCGLKNFCWVTSHNETMRSLDDMTLVLRKNGSLNIENLPVFLKQKCCKQQNLINAINFEYREFVCKEQTSRRINEARAIAAEQFTGMAELLVEMSQEISGVIKIDYDSSVIVKNILQNRGIDASGIFCFLDEFDRLTIDIYISSALDSENLKIIAQITGECLGKDIEFPTITKAGCDYKISFFEAASLKIDFAALQSSSYGDDCCGDSYDFFMDGKGYAHMLLSDGMGSGKRAAVDSLMTCSTMRKLIETGFGFKSTLKLLNLSFSIKSKDESLATIDVCTIDLYSGNAKFIKAGATSSYISSHGKVKELTSTSLPIGIIQGISFDSKEVKLSKGDVVVMVSDGVTASGFEWVLQELSLKDGQTAEKIASSLLQSAKKRENPNHVDDITVMVSRII